MLLDNKDLDLLCFTGIVRNLPCDMSSFLSDIFSQKRADALCKMGLLIKNRNKLSYSLTLEGVALISVFGFDYPLSDTTPSSQKLKRRLEASNTAALFYEGGFNIFSDNLFSLDTPNTYLLSSSFRNGNSQTRVFSGARFTGIARNEHNGFLVHYIDEGKMYFTNEMRLFNNAIMTHKCKPNVIYTGHSLSEILKYLTSQSAFTKAKRNKNDAVTYRIALERTTYPLHIIECSHKGAFQLRLMSCPDYRNQIVEYAFSQSVTQNENTVIDAEINGEMFAVGVDLDLTRLKKATELASKSGRTSLSVIALPW